jgi:hypothetical protein
MIPAGPAGRALRRVEHTMVATPPGRFCTRCGKPLAPGASFCSFCGAGGGAAGPPRNPDADATGGIIPYKNPYALIAYYCGVFSIIPCFPIGLAALVLGILRLKHARQHPESKGKVHAWIGIVAGAIFGILWTVLTVMGLVAGLAT